LLLAVGLIMGYRNICSWKGIEFICSCKIRSDR